MDGAACRPIEFSRDGVACGAEVSDLDNGSRPARCGGGDLRFIGGPGRRKSAVGRRDARYGPGPTITRRSGVLIAIGFAGKQNVLRLEIPVHDAVVMTVHYSRQELHAHRTEKHSKRRY